MKKQLIKFAGFTAVFVLFALIMPASAFAATAGAFEVTGDAANYSFTGTSGTDGVLTITGGGALIIANTDPITPTLDKIVVENGVTANITLSGVNIDVSSSDFNAAFEIIGNATANITLINANTLKSGREYAGLQVKSTTSETATLNITKASTGSLHATGGGSLSEYNASAGIGGGNYENSGIINISGGTITAIGGNSSSGGGASGGGASGGGAGIGGGANGNSGTITIGDNAIIANAQGGNGAAGIGGGYSGDVGTITINGGEITATGGSSDTSHISGAGIGAGAFGAGGTINISGGKIIATGGKGSSYGAAGIGGCGNGTASSYDGGKITISGGEITATGGTGNGGGNGGAGIGGGSRGAGGEIKINGSAIIQAQGGIDAAGIGGGSEGAGGIIQISGGTILNAQGGTNSPGIGNGYGGTGGTFTTTATGNAFIIAKGDSYANAISDDNNKSNWSGVIFENNDDGLVYGTPTLATNAEIPSGKTLNIESGKTLTIDASATLTNSGTLLNNGTLKGQGSLSGSGSFQTNVLKSEYITGIQIGGYVKTGKVIAVSPAIQNPTILGNVFTVDGWTNSIEKQDANGTTWSASAVQDIGNYRVVYKNSRYADIVIPFKVSAPSIIKGEHQTILRGESISFTSNAEFVDYVDTELTKGGTTASQIIHSAATGDSKDVTAQNGSIIVTLSSAYTATLPLGTHTISINSASGSAITTFTVTEESTTSETYNPAISPLTGVYNK